MGLDLRWYCQVGRVWPALESDSQRICGIARSPGRYLCQRGEELFHYGGVIHDISETTDAMQRACDRRQEKLQARFDAKRKREGEEYMAKAPAMFARMREHTMYMRAVVQASSK